MNTTAAIINKRLILLYVLGTSILVGLAYKANITICMFKRIFHMPCPGCGMTRAFDSIIFRRDFGKAIHYNALSIPLFIFIIVSFFWIVVDIIRKKDTFIKTFGGEWPKKYIALVSVVVLINWIWDIQKGI